MAISSAWQLSRCIRRGFARPRLFLLRGLSLKQEDAPLTTVTLGVRNRMLQTMLPGRPRHPAKSCCTNILDVLLKAETRHLFHVDKFHVANLTRTPYEKKGQHGATRPSLSLGCVSVCFCIYSFAFEAQTAGKGYQVADIDIAQTCCISKVIRPVSALQICQGFRTRVAPLRGDALASAVVAAFRDDNGRQGWQGFGFRMRSE